MNKKVTAIIFVGGILVISILGILLTVQPKNIPLSILNSPTPLQMQTTQTVISPTPDLSFASLRFVQRDNANIDIVLDTAGKEVNAIQLSLSFDKLALKNMQLSPGSLMANSFILKNNTDNDQGTIFYAAAILPGKQLIKGTGVIATLNYTVNSGVISPTTIHVLPATKVTASGIDQSILKQTPDFTFNVTQ